MARKIVLVLMVMALWAGVAYAKDLEVKKTAGDNTVVIKMDKNPPIVGENKITVEIVDKMGKYVKDAKVMVNYGMPAMPGMGAMNYDTALLIKDNAYVGKLDLSMGGSWNITAKVTQGAKTYAVKFTIDAR